MAPYGKILVDLRVLTNMGLSTFGVYCSLYQPWYEAEQAVLKAGTLLQSRKGGVYQNPYLAIANKALVQMQWFWSRFGMTPADRARIGVDPTDVDGPLEEFLFGNQPRVG